MNPWQNPSIELFGIRVDEPVTTFTDLIVAAVGLIGFMKTASSDNGRSVSLYRYFFLFTALSTLVAAFFGHAFTYHFGMKARMIGWVIGMIGVAFAQFAVLNNSRETISKNLFSVLAIVNIIELIVVTVALVTYQAFFIVEIHSAFGMVLMVTILEAFNYSKTKSDMSRNMVIGVALATAAVICHVAQLAMSKWFNHLDMSHIFMALALYVMYRGVAAEQKLNTSVA